ncbi:hypothetical protein EDC96DRAFT_499422 [Choanephora cucurbitarum]|nr:hypothetical protein EDC96DRAFT_499422 [Choanephora cucurbitarum]
MFRFICCLIVLLAVTQVFAIDYIIALKPPVTEASYEQVRKDVQSMGGKITYEFRASLKAVLASLPSGKINTLSSKPYVDFVEEDKSVHI